jgi:predicted nucleotidyltransferase
MTPQEDILGRLDQHTSSLAESFSVRRIGLFGSFLHGQVDDNSDVNILVELDEPGFDN